MTLMENMAYPTDVVADQCVVFLGNGAHFSRNALFPGSARQVVVSKLLFLLQGAQFVVHCLAVIGDQSFHTAYLAVDVLQSALALQGAGGLLDAFQFLCISR